MSIVLALSDLHCGHRAGLTSPKWHVSNATPNVRALQRKMWDKFADGMRELDRVDLCLVMGDCIDGRGEKSGGTELVTTDRIVQTEIAIECLRQVHAKRYIFVYGTPYHTGSETDYEGLIAKEFNAEIHSHAWPKIDGVVFDCKHKVGASQIPHGRHTAIAREALWNREWSDGQPRADVLLRGHVHYHQFVGDSRFLGMTLPALQAADTKYGARQCSGTVDWGWVVFKTGKQGLESWQANVTRLVKANVTQF